MKFLSNTKEYIYLKTINNTEHTTIIKSEIGCLTILWFLEDNNVIQVDGQEIHFTKNQIVFLTEFHNVTPLFIGETRILKFNRPFYCVLDHDSEVGCKGILFFGATQLPVIEIPEDEFLKFDVLWSMFTLEIQSNDNLQIEMLQVMLKRYLILCARLYKEQQKYPIEDFETDLIREYNFLVEQHFREKHSVSEYAKLLHKSPKTLSNVFSKFNAKTPSQYIHDRILLEARRMLMYSEKSIKEIAYALGYESIQTFSRFFKKHEGISPAVLRNAQSGKTVNGKGMIA